MTYILMNLVSGLPKKTYIPVPLYLSFVVLPSTTLGGTNNNKICYCNTTPVQQDYSCKIIISLKLTLWSLLSHALKITTLYQPKSVWCVLHYITINVTLFEPWFRQYSLPLPLSHCLDLDLNDQKAKRYHVFIWK